MMEWGVKFESWLLERMMFLVSNYNHSQKERNSDVLSASKNNYFK